MIEVGMGQQNSLNLHSLGSAQKSRRIRTGINDDAASGIRPGKQIGIRLKGPQIIGTNI
ncbi:hypothetical protein D3C75_1310210 [compost metagenome]